MMSTDIRKQILYVLATLLAVFSYQIATEAQEGETEDIILAVPDRTSQVRDAIVAAVPGVTDAADVTNTQLAAITSLNLRNKRITALISGDFSGMTGLTNINLFGNQLSSLPDGIFKGLTSLTTLRLGGNTVNPIQVAVTLEETDTNTYKVVIPTGAPFTISVSIVLTDGVNPETLRTVTVPKGSVESMSFTASSVEGATIEIGGTLPSLPQNHYGYTLIKVVNTPDTEAEVQTETQDTETQTTEETIEGPQTETQTEVTENSTPAFMDGTITARSIAENSPANTNIGNAVEATDTNTDDTLTYTLTGRDAASFSVDAATGQLKTKAALDYETKNIYIVTITVSDGNLSDTISVIVSVIDVADTTITTTSLSVGDRTPEVRDAIVAAIPGVTDAADVTDSHLAALTSLNLRNKGITALKSGDFSGLTGLTSLNLYGNLLSHLPMGIFEGLTSLSSLRLGGNTIDPIPLIVSLEQVNMNQFKAVISTGAPFDVVLTVGTMTITIPKGSIKSDVFTTDETAEIGNLPTLPVNNFGYVLAKSTVCQRSLAVTEAITDAVADVDDCRNISKIDLAKIISLDLSGKTISTLQSDDFSGLFSLTELNLSNNILSNLPSGIFDDLTSLTTLNLSNNNFSNLPNGIFDSLTSLTTIQITGNAVNPLPLTLSLVKVGEDQIKATSSTEVPFAIELPVQILTGSVVTSKLSLTIPLGNTESEPGTIQRPWGTTAAITANIGNLPTHPAMHTGYALVKSESLPIVVTESVETETTETKETTETTVKTPVRNAAPVFTAGNSATLSVPENTGSGLNIGIPISATDKDEDTLTYTLGGTDAAAFNIVSTTGQIRTDATLDYETKSSYSVTVTVSDNNGGTDSIKVTINVTDVDESPSNRVPVFTAGDSTTLSIAENTLSGVDIGSAISATDADNDTLTYSLGGTDSSSFSIDSSSGQIRTNAALDYETKSSYIVMISVSDGNGGSDAISVTINITDVDESPANRAPAFTAGDSTTLSIAENTLSGVDIGSAISATDADNDTLSYSLSGTDASSFSIDSSSGQIRTDTALDYETKSSYAVTVNVSDGNGGSDSINVTINVINIDETPLNNNPEFTAGDSTTLSVPENTLSGVDIGSAISATDEDNDTLSYSLSGTDASSFSIDSSSGQIRTDASLDYETTSSYSVTVSVSDNKGGSDAISVTINVTDVDETPTNNAPVFSEGSSTTRTIAENTNANVNIGIAISATDADQDTLTYSLSGTDAASFNIDTNTGQLKTNAALNYESKSSYSVSVAASDDSLSDTISVTINVTDVNEAPVFTDGSTTARSIAENVGTDINIGKAVTATDPESNTLTYTLGGTDAASFSIDSKTGQLKTKTSLDYETKTAYTVVITVSDNSLRDTITVTINVTDLDEAPVNEPPTFTEGAATTRSIAENSRSGTNIGSAITATDADNNKLAYFLSGTDSASFEINANTGQLKSNVDLDHEDKDTYTVTVSVTDGSATDTITVTINVTDVNEAPVLDNGDSITLTIAENTVADTNIGSALDATDPDEDALTYSLGGTDAASFSIDSKSGQVKTKAALDFETKAAYTVTVTVTDSKLTDSITVTINITDVDENVAPVFTDGTSTSRSVAENTGTGIDIGTPIAATDANSGDTLTYTLGGTDAAAFSINSTNGQLRTKAALDYESKTSYTVTVTVSDSKLTDSITVTITITDVDENVAPVFTDGASTSRSIAENTGTGVDIGTPIAATDANSGDTLTYTLGGTDAAAFSINSTNGQLRTKAALDYESKTSYTVTVTVSDSQLTDSITVTITITDVDENVAPVFTDGASTSRSVAENTGTGVDIGTPIAATDANSGDTLTYTLGGTDAAAFSINSTNGQLRTKAALDYESKTSYTVTITVSDGHEGTDSITVTINVTDVKENRAPTFTAGSSTTRTIAENTGSGVDIGTPIAATDADKDTLTYSLGGTDATSFSINSTTGQLQTKAALDHETKSSYSVSVTVSDNKLTDSITVTITVTDGNDLPAFGSETAALSVAENTAADTNIDSPVTATDQDDEPITYLLGGTDASAFTIDAKTGQIKTKSALDRETKASYTISVIASDTKDAGTITVTITVTDVNEAPSFTDGSSTTRSVAENTDADTNIGTPVAATDPEEDTLEYTLGGTDAASFAIDDDTGQLKTKGALDYETKTSYSVKITVSDNTLEDNINVTINVTDVFENMAPIFTDGATTTRSVAENTSAGTNIGTPVSATDAENHVLTYTLGGTDAASFSIVSTTGQLRTKGALNYELKNSYTVTITVTDTHKGSDSITVTINITNVRNEGTQELMTEEEESEIPQLINNNVPSFTDGASTTRSIAENTASGTNIGTAVSATDEDPSDILNYTLGGTDAASFAIVSTTGQLQTKADLDYETKTLYTVTITVTDGEGGSDTITVTINVTNVNEEGVNELPEFTDGVSTTLSIAENTASGTNIGTAIAATDLDTDDVLTYTLSGTDAASFAIVGTSGQIQTSAALNYEKKKVYSVTVSVSDGNGGTDSIAVTINVTNVNEAPYFVHGNSLTIDIPEDLDYYRTTIGSAIYAYDEDADVNLSIPFPPENEETAPFAFEVGSDFVDDNPSLGVIPGNAYLILSLTNTANLNVENKSRYSFTLTVTDGHFTTSSTITINVHDPADFMPPPLTPRESNQPPTFLNYPAIFLEIPENAGPKHLIGNPISVRDPDDDYIVFSLGGTDAGSFDVTYRGQLRTKRRSEFEAFDFETKQSYSLTLTISDRRGGTATGNVTINITDSNDAPVFTEGEAATRSIPENTATNTSIGAAVSATDQDANATITYSLGGTDASSFSIESTSGQLKTKAALDYETKTTYSVKVTATDNGNLTDSIVVTINVTDLNETPSTNAPEFTEGTAAIRSIAENTAKDTNIGSPVSATDDDANTTLAYTLSGTDASKFSIDSTTGQLKTNADLDYEDDTSHSVTVTVTDGVNTDTITVTINVTNVNEAPAFTDGTSTSRSVNEHVNIGTRVGAAVAAIDPDSGDTLTYALSGTDATSFTVRSTDGQLFTAVELDYETKSSYTVTITVSDGNGGSDTITVQINVGNINENRAPTFVDGTMTSRSVEEGTEADRNIGTPIAATDPNGDTLNYAIIEGPFDHQHFTIDSSTGQLKTKSPLRLSDYRTYTVQLQVTDIHGAYDRIVVDITVRARNAAPHFRIGNRLNDRATFSVRENRAAGYPFGELIEAYDRDSDPLTITLGGTDAASFSINTSTESSPVRIRLVTKALLDYETKTTYTVTVTATDDNAASKTATITINVTDMDPETNSDPTFTAGDSTTLSVSEDTGSGQNIGSPISATDSDNDTLLYSLSGTDAESFSIDSTTGQLKTSATLDYETQTSYSVIVTVTDHFAGGTPDTINVTINVTDVTENNAPVFNDGDSKTLDFAEHRDGIDRDAWNLNNNSTIGTPISATDADSDALLYSISPSYSGFSINFNTGQLSSTLWLDHESKSTHNLTVKVIDTQGDSDTISVTVNITDRNEKPTYPSASATAYVTDEAAANTSIGEDLITPDDPDQDETFTYTLSGTDAASFTLNSTTGVLQNNAVLDKDTKSSYSLTITANDGEYTATLNLTVEVLDPPNPAIASRTPAVREAIVNAIPNVDSYVDVHAVNLASITSLNLSNKSISSLSAGDFNGMTGLENLNLNNNNLTSLPSGILDETPNLEHFSIESNRLRSLNGNLFDNCRGIISINLYFNYISSIPDGFFVGLTSLLGLYLHQDDIMWLPIRVNVVKVEDDDNNDQTAKYKLHIPSGTPAKMKAEVWVYWLSDGVYVDVRKLSELTVPKGGTESNVGTLTRDDLTDNDDGEDIYLGTVNGKFSRVAPIDNLVMHFRFRQGDRDLIIPANNGAPSNVGQKQIPLTTGLLPNFPNPFNPETWIPYQLNKASAVSITVYDISGNVVRHLDLGHQRAGFYTDRSRAAHWDGRNSTGERVANGVYFYQLKTGDYSYLRKMVIVK